MPGTIRKSKSYMDHPLNFLGDRKMISFTSLNTSLLPGEQCPRAHKSWEKWSRRCRKCSHTYILQPTEQEIGTVWFM